MCCRNNNNNDNNNNQVNTNIANSANMQISILKQSHRHRHQHYSNYLHQHHPHHHGPSYPHEHEHGNDGATGLGGSTQECKFSVSTGALYVINSSLCILLFHSQCYNMHSRLLSLPCSFIGLMILNHFRYHGNCILIVCLDFNL